jgi:hypothetical protein
MGSVKSKPSGGPPPPPSVSSVDESSNNGPNQEKRSFHEALVRERDHKHDFNDIYEMLEEIGQGGICKIYKIKKKDEMMGGSSREENVRKSKSIIQRISPRITIRPKAIKRGYSGEAPEGAHKYFALKVINLALVKEDSIDQLRNEGTGTVSKFRLWVYLRPEC